MEFNLPKEQSSIIKVIGVGGGGSNAVNHMYKQGIKGVDFMVCNTDQQALDVSPVPIKVQLGATLTDGRGAGSLPEVGKNAAIENIDAIKEVLESNTKMVFVTAGMGGGTGTGAAPVIAQAARELGILTVGIVTIPFSFEGKKRRMQAEEGIKNLREQVDTLLLINNDKLREMYGNLSLANAFEQADNVLTTASKGIAEIITRTGYINVDFEDVRTVMTDSGVAIMGSASADGEGRAIKAVEQALSSPLLNDNHIAGARYILMNITFGNQEVLMDEISDITDYIQDEAGSTADVIWGYGIDEELESRISVTIIATGFTGNQEMTTLQTTEPKKRRIPLEEERPVSLTQPVAKTEEPSPKHTFEWNKEQEEVPFSAVETPTASSSDAQTAFEFRLKEDGQTVASTPETVANDSPTDGSEGEAEGRSTAFEPYLKSDGAEDSVVPSAPTNAVDQQPSAAWEDNEAALPSTPPDEADTATPPPNTGEESAPETRQQRVSDRISKLRELSSRLRTPSGISDLENEPAYKRRNVTLNEVQHSSESEVSRYTLSNEENQEEGEEGRTEIRPNNSFLHDNVD